MLTEKVGHTTTHLAVAALARGHETWHLNLADFTLEHDNRVTARAFGPRGPNPSAGAYVEYIRNAQAAHEKIIVSELDALFLRNDPAEDVVNRPWARLAGINFGRFAKDAGVLVVNDPDGLGHAINKLYLQHFPRKVRPEAIVSRDKNEIAGFIREMDRRCVIKPLNGSGGHNVFVLEPGDHPNRNQMIEAVIAEGFALVQAYVEGASGGDIRLLMIDGEILEADGRPAIIRRRHAEGDLRNNISAGGKAETTALTASIRSLAQATSARLKEDGVFLAGLDIVGDKILEINVFSPGAMAGASRLYGVSFETEVIKALELKRSFVSGAQRKLR